MYSAANELKESREIADRFFKRLEEALKHMREDIKEKSNIF